MRFFSLLAFLSAARAGAALLVYEGFNGYTAGTGLGTGDNTNPNAGTIGLNTGVAWSGNGASNYVPTNTGLTFGSLTTTGGAATFTAGTAVLAGQMDLSSSATGTLWNSFLVRFTSKGSADGNGFTSRIANDNSTSGVRFQSFADNRAGTGNTEASVRYADSNTNGTSGVTLANNTTYLILSSFTNAGQSLTSGNPGVATMFVLTLSQFENLVAAADWQAYLDAATQGNEVTVKATQNQTANTYSFANGNYAHFVSVGDNGTVDELRWGSDLASVIPIPEPATGTLALLACASVLSRRKRTLA